MVYVTHDQIEAMTLATKIVVMKGGHIQQIGAPSEIYDRPANLFVADFMGNPAMNLIPAKVRKVDGESRIEIARRDDSPILLRTDDKTKLPEDVILGLRPEDIAEAGHRAGDAMQTISCHISMVETAGADTYVTTELGGKQMTARLHAETKARAGTPLNLAVDMSKVSFFAPDTGLRFN